MIDYSQDKAHLSWVEARLGIRFDRETAVWLTSLSQTGTILGVVVFSRFTTGNCEITVVADSPRFISKTFAYAVAGYAFMTLGCRRVTAFIAVDNQKSLDLAQRLGFRVEGTARQWFESGDAFLLGILREDCSNWFKDKHGQPLPAAST